MVSIIVHKQQSVSVICLFLFYRHSNYFAIYFHINNCVQKTCVISLSNNNTRYQLIRTIYTYIFLISGTIRRLFSHIFTQELRYMCVFCLPSFKCFIECVIVLFKFNVYLIILFKSTSSLLRQYFGCYKLFTCLFLSEKGYNKYIFC
jgi:hypothetical protein